jgi:tRNA G18 (ribose-2'-O)-methylase SpoU
VSVSGSQRVSDATDPRLSDFLDLRDEQFRRRHEAEEGLFLAEGSKTIRRAVAAGFPLRKILLTERWLHSLEDIAGSADVLVVEDHVMEATVGFPVHRGALASMDRKPLPSLDDVLRGAARIAVLEDLVDHTNVGAVFRSAAALGVDGVVLTPRCGDPLYRRAVRTSMGAVFNVPWTRIHWREGPAVLKAAGFTLASLTPAADAVELGSVEPTDHPRLALVVGNEGRGSSSHWLEAADLRLRIPMRTGIDSLNAAAAAAVAFYALAPHA